MYARKTFGSRRHFEKKPEDRTVRHHLNYQVVAALLIKVAKHIAVLSCMAIVSHATGRLEVSQITIFAIVSAAVCLHSAGRTLQRRFSNPLAPTQVGS